MGCAVGVRVRGAVVALFAVALLGAAPPPERSTGGMVAADHRLGSMAGAEVMAQGGNAVDAAVAAALAVGVVQPAGSGLGGGGFAVVVDESGDSAVVDFREVAPAAATETMYIEAQSRDASRIGGLAVGVPGEPLGLVELHRRWGLLPLSTVASPAVRLAREGFQVEAHLAKALAKAGVAGPGLSRGLFDSESVPVGGEFVRRERLASTIEAFASSNGQALMSGPIAEEIVSTVQAAGGSPDPRGLEVVPA